jgi:hypothetical protein
VISVIAAMLRDRVLDVQKAGVQALVKLVKFGKTICLVIICTF